MGNETKTQEIREAIEQGVSAPHQAAGIALHLFLLIHDSRQGSAELEQLKAQLLKRLPAWGMGNLISIQVAYARNLASSPRPLEYEEMHKLFSLCDEIRALRSLGLAETTSDLDQLEADLRERFSAEPRKAKLVAEDRAEDWNRALWWYADNLASP